MRVLPPTHVRRSAHGEVKAALESGLPLRIVSVREHPRLGLLVDAISLLLDYAVVVATTSTSLPQTPSFLLLFLALRRRRADEAPLTIFSP